MPFLIPVCISLVVYSLQIFLCCRKDKRLGLIIPLLLLTAALITAVMSVLSHGDANNVSLFESITLDIGMYISALIFCLIAYGICRNIKKLQIRV